MASLLKQNQWTLNKFMQPQKSGRKCEEFMFVFLFLYLITESEYGLQEKGREFLFTKFRLVFLGCLSSLVKKKEKMCSWFKHKDKVI